VIRCWYIRENIPENRSAKVTIERRRGRVKWAKCHWKRKMVIQGGRIVDHITLFHEKDIDSGQCTRRVIQTSVSGTKSENLGH